MPIVLPQVEVCYFCQIVDGVVDRWNVVEESDRTITVLNGRQFEVGQCMVLPKRHAPTLLDLTSEEQADVMAAATRIMRAVVQAFDPEGVLIYQNNGVASGQEVPHFHLHVVPRRSASDWGSGPPQIAHVETAKRPPHLDHAMITEAKQETAAELRRALTKG